MDSLPGEIANLIICRSLSFREEAKYQMAFLSNITSKATHHVILKNGITVRSGAYSAFYVVRCLKENQRIMEEILAFEDFGVDNELECQLIKDSASKLIEDKTLNGKQNGLRLKLRVYPKKSPKFEINITHHEKTLSKFFVADDSLVLRKLIEVLCYNERPFLFGNNPNKRNWSEFCNREHLISLKLL